VWLVNRFIDSLNFWHYDPGPLKTSILTQSSSAKYYLPRIYNLLSNSEKRKAWLLLLGVLANGFVEILGLSALVPVISLVIDPTLIQSNEYLKTLQEFLGLFGISDSSEFLTCLCILLVSAFLFKAVFGLLIQYLQARFSFKVAHRLSGLMWSHHFSKSLEQLKASSTGHILTEINIWPLIFAKVFMLGGLMIITEAVITAVIIGGLLYYNPFVFATIGSVLLAGTLVVQRLTSRILTKYSEIRGKLEPKTNELISDAIRGFVEILTFRASETIRGSYLKDLKEVYQIQGNTAVIALAPAKFYEVLAVSGISLAIIISLQKEEPQHGFLNLLTFMAIGAYRVMPSLSRLNSIILQMKSQEYVLPAIETSKTQSDLCKSFSKHKSKLNRIDIRFRNLTVTYKELTSPIISSLSHEFQSGQVNCIIGPSGSGKSTLINALLSLHSPEGGCIEITEQGGKKFLLGDDLDFDDWISNVGYVCQSPFLFQGSFHDNLTLRVPDRHVDFNLIHNLVDSLNLSDCLGDNPLSFSIQEGGGNLSGGQKQRIALARALQTTPSVLILDEAMNALDQESKQAVFRQLSSRAKSGCNVILVTHDPTLASWCDSILDLENQKG